MSSSNPTPSKEVPEEAVRAAVKAVGPRIDHGYMWTAMPIALRAALPFITAEYDKERERLEEEYEARLKLAHDRLDTVTERAEKAEAAQPQTYSSGIGEPSELFAAASNARSLLWTARGKRAEDKAEALDTACEILTNALTQQSQPLEEQLTRFELDRLRKMVTEAIEENDREEAHQSWLALERKLNHLHTSTPSTVRQPLEEDGEAGKRGCTESERVRLEDALRLLAMTHFDHERLITDENFDATDLFESGHIQHREIGQTGEYDCHLTAEGMEAVQEALGLPLGTPATQLEQDQGGDCRRTAPCQECGEIGGRHNADCEFGKRLRDLHLRALREAIDLVNAIMQGREVSETWARRVAAKLGPAYKAAALTQPNESSNA